MRLVIGDEVGQLKAVGLGDGWLKPASAAAKAQEDSEGADGSRRAKGKKLRGVAGASKGGRIVTRLGKVDRDQGIERLSWADPNDWRAGTVWSTTDGAVRFSRCAAGPDVPVFGTKTEVIEDSLIETFDGFKFDDGCKGLEAHDGHLFTCSGAGNVQACKFDPRAVGKKAFDKDAGVVATWSAGEHVSRIRRSTVTNLLATGGKNNDLKLWDIATQQAVFKARNVPHDFLDMEVPVWVTDMCFFPGSGSGPAKSLSGGAPEKVVTCTAYSYVRLYDTRVQRRPVQTADFSKPANKNEGRHSAASYHMNCIVAVDDNHVVVSNNTGEVFQIDLRTMALAGRYKPFAGSVRSLAMHPTLPLMASVGLDRYVKVHNTESRDLVLCIYAKQRLSTVLFADETPVVPERQSGSERVAVLDKTVAAADDDDVHSLSDMDSGDDDEDAGKEDKVKMPSRNKQGAPKRGKQGAKARASPSAKPAAKAKKDGPARKRQKRAA